MKKKFTMVIFVLFITLSVFADERNWKQFSERIYLDTNRIEYYKDELGFNHAIVYQKLIPQKGNRDDVRIDKICMNYYKKHLGYLLIEEDININKKTSTLNYVTFFDFNENELGIVTMGKKEDCTLIPPLTVENDIYQYIINTKDDKYNR